MKKILILILLMQSYALPQELIVGSSLQPVTKSWGLNQLENINFGAAFRTYISQKKLSYGLSAELNLNQYNTYGISLITQYDINKLRINAGVGLAATTVKQNFIIYNGLIKSSTSFSPLLNLGLQYDLFEMGKGALFAELNYKYFHYSGEDLISGLDTLRGAQSKGGDIMIQLGYRFKK